MGDPNAQRLKLEQEFAKSIREDKASKNKKKGASDGKGDSDSEKNERLIPVTYYNLDQYPHADFKVEFEGDTKSGFSLSKDYDVLRQVNAVVTIPSMKVKDEHAEKIEIALSSKYAFASIKTLKVTDGGELFTLDPEIIDLNHFIFKDGKNVEVKFNSSGRKLTHECFEGQIHSHSIDFSIPSDLFTNRKVFPRNAYPLGPKSAFTIYPKMASIKDIIVVRRKTRDNNYEVIEHITGGVNNLSNFIEFQDTSLTVDTPITIKFYADVTTFPKSSSKNDEINDLVRSDNTVLHFHRNVLLGSYKFTGQDDIVEGNYKVTVPIKSPTRVSAYVIILQNTTSSKTCNHLNYEMDFLSSNKLGIIHSVTIDGFEYTQRNSELEKVPGIASDKNTFVVTTCDINPYCKDSVLSRSNENIEVLVSNRINMFIKDLQTVYTVKVYGYVPYTLSFNNQVNGDRGAVIQQI